MTTWLQGFKTLWVETPHIKPPSDKFGDHKTSSKEGIAYLIYHVHSRDHVIQDSCDFIEGRSLFFVS